IAVAVAEATDLLGVALALRPERQGLPAGQEGEQQEEAGEARHRAHPTPSSREAKACVAPRRGQPQPRPGRGGIPDRLDALQGLGEALGAVAGLALLLVGCFFQLLDGLLGLVAGLLGRTVEVLGAAGLLHLVEVLLALAAGAAVATRPLATPGE